MKTQVSFIFSFLFISLFSFAQTKTVITEKIKVWGNCEMCKSTIEKAAKTGGASYALWNEEAKILTVKFETSKTSSKKIQDKVAAAGYDTQDVTAPDAAYKKLPGCCQYDRKATEKKEDAKATSMNCCKDKETCKKDCCKKEDMSCCKGTTAKEASHDCCKKESNCCSK